MDKNLRRLCGQIALERYRHHIWDAGRLLRDQVRKRLENGEDQQKVLVWLQTELHDALTSQR